MKHIFVAPGSHGIAEIDKVENVSLDINNFKVFFKKLISREGSDEMFA